MANNEKHPSGGTKLKGNSRPYKPLMDLEKELNRGFAFATRSKINQYRDGVKDISAQILRKSINQYNANLNFNFVNFINNIYDFEKDKKEVNAEKKLEDERSELKNFYSCFNDYFDNKTHNIDSKLSHYKARDIKIIKRAIVDIEHYLDHTLIKLFETLNNQYNYYKPNDEDSKLITSINKLKTCYDIIKQICEIARFLFFNNLPLSITTETYNELEKLSCKAKEFYEKENNQTYKCKFNNVTFISLGHEGAAYFYKTL